MAPNSTNQLKFPWEDLKAETLRAVARDLGFRRTAQSRQTLMTFLESVEVNGLESGLENIDVELDKNPKKLVAKRKFEGDSRETRVRLQGADRRTRASDPGPGLPPRKRTMSARAAAAIESSSTAASRTHKRRRVSGPTKFKGKGKETNRDGAGEGETRPSSKQVLVTAGQETSPKGGRGRPRKFIFDIPKSKAPESMSKQIFDGVVLLERKRVSSHDEVVAEQKDVDGEGSTETRMDDIQGEDGEYIAAGDDDEYIDAGEDGEYIDEVINGLGDTSSLGGSNKENEIVLPLGDEDAEGEADDMVVPIA